MPTYIYTTEVKTEGFNGPNSGGLNFRWDWVIFKTIESEYPSPFVTADILVDVFMTVYPFLF